MKIFHEIQIFFARLKPVMKKELRQISRDMRIMMLLLVFPAVLLVLLGYALNFDVKHIKVIFCDEDKSPESRKFIEQFSNTEYFDLINVTSERGKIDEFILNGDAKCAIIIPSDFSKKNLNNEISPFQVILDGSDGNTAGTTLNYIMLISQEYSQNLILKYSEKAGIHMNEAMEFRPAIWFNPELKTAKFLLPGLIAFILMIVGTVSTTLSIVKEIERGTMEQIQVSPLNAFEIIFGKTLPYLLFGLIATTLILIFGMILFDISIKGNIILFYVNTIFFILGALGMGIFISTISDSTQVAFQIAAVATILPTFILSGFIFPLKNMPLILQIISYIVPAKYFIIILRSLMLKGVGVSAYWEQFIFMLLYGVIMFTLSAIRFSRRRIK
jgi:ABC-2 type transport system permease protein